MKFNRKSFFTGYREVFGKLNQSQVDGLEFLLDRIEQDEWSTQQASYVLATVDHETAHTFQPIREKRERADSPRRANQDRYWLSGFYGRGLVQITWRKNYQKFGIDDEPNKALEPETAYEILSKGMKEGLFTGKSIGDFINDEKTDYRNARRVVNGLDKADLIAKRARNFEAILSTSLQGGIEISDEPGNVIRGNVVTPKPEPDKPEPEKSEPSVTTVPGKPPVIEVQPRGTSITTKIAAGASAVAPVIAATGLKIGGVEFKTGGLIAIAAVIIVGMVLAAWLWNQSQIRRHEELKLSMANLASPDRLNVVAGDTKT